jgi:hypothetical protein
MPVSVSITEAPLPGPHWVYPCKTADLAATLADFPDEDLAGLSAVRLQPATRKDCLAYGRYFYGQRPEIHLYSMGFDLTLKLDQRTRRSDIENSCACLYGLRVERIGSRWICRWDPEDWRRYTLEHVLPHELGHHVYDRRRLLQGYVHKSRTRDGEQFAEDYALRWAKRLGDERSLRL